MISGSCFSSCEFLLNENTSDLSVHGKPKEVTETNDSKQMHLVSEASDVHSKKQHLTGTCQQTNSSYFEFTQTVACASVSRHLILTETC